MYKTISARVMVVGNALMGVDNDNRPLSIRAQHDVLSAATRGEIIAAKVLIEEYYPTSVYAILKAECYAKEAKSAVWSIAS